MTTIVVVKKAGRACIAADTLAKYGDALESADYIANADKLIPIGDSWLAAAGPAAIQQVLKSYFADKNARRDFKTVQGIFESLLEMQGVLKDNYFLNPKEDERDPFDSMQAEILLASPGGIFGAYPLRSVMEYTRFYAFGSGAEYAMGAMHAVYERYERVEAIAAAGIEAAAAFDDSTGLPYTLKSLELQRR
ncbi:MAG: hypothetical protein GY711_35425 [bacterium]|nr:hypothetical protein [bacterium]